MKHLLKQKNTQTRLAQKILHCAEQTALYNWFDRRMFAMAECIRFFCSKQLVWVFSIQKIQKTYLHILSKGL